MEAEGFFWSSPQFKTPIPRTFRHHFLGASPQPWRQEAAPGSGRACPRMAGLLMDWSPRHLVGIQSRVGSGRFLQAGEGREGQREEGLPAWS